VSEHEIHRAAKKISRWTPERFKLLVEQIKANGLLIPIIRRNGVIIDGRHRERACIEAGVEPHYIDLENQSHYTGDDWDVVADANLVRRHSDDNQRALDVRRLVTDKRKHTKQLRLAGVSDECAAMADIVVRDAIDDVVAAVEIEDMPLDIASAIAQREPEEQATLLERYRAAASTKQEPVRAVSEPEPIKSRSVPLSPAAIRQLGELVRLAEGQRRNSDAYEGARWVRLLVPEVDQ
jgi:hypothetical protein